MAAVLARWLSAIMQKAERTLSTLTNFSQSSPSLVGELLYDEDAGELTHVTNRARMKAMQT